MQGWVVRRHVFYEANKCTDVLDNTNEIFIILANSSFLYQPFVWDLRGWNPIDTEAELKIHLVWSFNYAGLNR